MRVIAGEFKRRQLKSVPSSLTRPTTDKNKENLFNMIGPYFDGGNCLDLFAGSGGLGIEALSRGMDYLYSVDKQYKAFLTIQENCRLLKIEDRVSIWKMDALKALDRLKTEDVKFDLVLLDPPYGLKKHGLILNQLVEMEKLNPGCLIVIEDLNEEAIDVAAPFVLKKQQSYGITTLQILKYEG